LSAPRTTIGGSCKIPSMRLLFLFYQRAQHIMRKPAPSSFPNCWSVDENQAAAPPSTDECAAKVDLTRPKPPERKDTPRGYVSVFPYPPRIVRTVSPPPDVAWPSCPSKARLRSRISRFVTAHGGYPHCP
ncbi:hypothetical protein Salat_0666500, partial [Sesamum alatum]